MPGEDTNEMMKVRAVQGELEDLPEDNPRATLSSRIRSLLLRATGIPQLIHLYGSLELDKTLTFAIGEDKTNVLFSDGSYLYAGLDTSPAKIVKVDLSDFTIVSTLTFAAGENRCYGLFSDGSYLYAGLDTSPAKIVKVDLSDFTIVSTLTFAAGEAYTTSLFSDGTYLYAGTWTSPGKVIRRYIVPSGATLRERKIDRTYERQVEQSMPLAMYGKVTTYTDTTHFKVSTLSRFGDNFFANRKWYVFVARDAGGASAAPDGEVQPISDYTSSDGTFEHTGFTVPLAVGDEVLILQEAIASAITSSTTINNIFDLVNGILTLTETGGTITTNGAVQTLYINNAPAGVFQPRKALIDFTNHVAGDVMVIRAYYRLNAAGGLIKQDEESIIGVQDPEIITIDLEDNRFGYEVTIEKTVGANLTYDWEVVFKA